MFCKQIWIFTSLALHIVDDSCLGSSLEKSLHPQALTWLIPVNSSSLDIFRRLYRHSPWYLRSGTGYLWPRPFTQGVRDDKFTLRELLDSSSVALVTHFFFLNTSASRLYSRYASIFLYFVFFFFFFFFFFFLQTRAICRETRRR